VVAERRHRVKRVQTWLVLVFLTLGAFLVHGYHPFAEDAEIYLPGVERILQPGLFSTDARFFDSYAHLSLFAPMVAESVRLSHLPLETTLFVWHLLSVFLLLLACRQLSERCFTAETARWSGVCTIAALLTLPIAGTALYIMDQYVNPRNLAAFAGIFAVTSMLRNRYWLAGFWGCFAFAVHPLMGTFVIFLCALLLGTQFKPSFFTGVFLLPLTLLSPPNSPAYMEAARLHPSHYLFAWRWYEWIGVIAPLAILWWFAVWARSRKRHQIHRLCESLILYGAICLGTALVFSLPRNFGPLARFQPLRGLHLLYVLMFLLIGGFLGEFVLKHHYWRWVALFLALCTGMWLAQRTLFPASSHIEWSYAKKRNCWAQAFLWVRDHTDIQSKFALDPDYLYIPGEDTNGFRAIAQRSKLSDAGKDSGEVSMFPNLAEKWWTEVQVQKNWRSFTVSDFAQLRRDYGVSWVILQPRTNLHLVCPYQNETVMVCRID